LYIQISQGTATTDFIAAGKVVTAEYYTGFSRSSSLNKKSEAY